jgi:hypothetical protein
LKTKIKISIDLAAKTTKLCRIGNLPESAELATFQKVEISEKLTKK